MIVVELLAFVRGESVAEHDAVDVIGLVLKATTKGAAGAKFELVAVLVLAAAGRGLGSCEIGVRAG